MVPVKFSTLKILHVNLLFFPFPLKLLHLIGAFALFYAEKYLQEAWPVVKGALKEHGISCELNLVSGFKCLFTVSIS